ncbi:MAG: HAD-IA family hydrolase [Deltaproteobacteria bacterium]|nr:HAD-IA family hydrolase [Deltaproteobacteria bacterium]
MKKKPLSLKAVLFDFDGTLTRPGALDFKAIRKALGCPHGLPILEFIESLPDTAEQARLLAQLDRFETEAAAGSVPNDGAEELILWLRAQGLHIGIITRNSRRSVERALENFTGVTPSDFDVLISRDDPASPKPSSHGILLAAQLLGVHAAEVLVVGDHLFDIEAGHKAGSPTAYLTNGVEAAGSPACGDYTVPSLDGLRSIVRLGLPLPSGKLPNALLAQFLQAAEIDDPDLLVYPGVGEDTAAVDVSGEEVLVLKSDPVTFVTDEISQYAVLVNANDIATAGAAPRWFLASILFPCGATADAILALLSDLRQICRRWGITLCGGHTEITDAVTRPVVSGSLIGTVRRDRLIDKRAMRPGDAVLMTKAAGIEGTSILARERGGRLRRLGMTKAEIETCCGFLSRISVLEEARIAAASPGVTAMHDVTEGGIATALEELGAAGGCRIRVNLDKIAVYPQTAGVCKLLGINPLGLIGSGCLLITCAKNNAETLMNALKNAGIDSVCVGEVLEKGQGMEALSNGSPAEWPRFDADELARHFRER